MIGTAISAGLGIVGGLSNLLGGNDARDQYRQYIKELKQEQMISDNIDPLKSAANNRIMTKLGEQTKENARQARAMESLGLQSKDQTVSTLNNNAKGMADAASAISANYEATRQANHNPYQNAINNAKAGLMQQNIAQGSEISSALKGLTSVGQAIAGGIGGTSKTGGSSLGSSTSSATNPFEVAYIKNVANGLSKIPTKITL